MSAVDLLAKLDKVRKRSGDSWTACCPAHDDRGPSLAVRELASGHVLVHCFAGCQTADVLDAVGLDYDVLFPPRERDAEFRKPVHPFSASDALRCLSFEADLVCIVASDLARGEPLDEDTRQRLLVAAGRLNQAAHLCHV